MKKILLIAAIVGAALAGCSKDNGGEEPQVTNSYTYDGQVFEVKWARGVYVTNGDGSQSVVIGLCPVVPAGSSIWDEPDLLVIGVWDDLLGQKASFNQSYDKNYALSGDLAIGGTYYGFGDESYPSNANLSGSDNWVQLTKQSDGTFTLEFSVVLYGKPFTGKCSGIQEDDGWWY
ncbi:MAG: hypothetical protein FWH23_02640 [Bacteroidales bacterium]|nr:hypothetical protein [Bacteroidales bacterium]